MPSPSVWLGLSDPTEALRALVGDPLVVLAAERDETGAAVDFSVAWANGPACAFLAVELEDLTGRRIGEMPNAPTAWGAGYVTVLETGHPEHFVAHRSGYDFLGHLHDGLFDVRIVKLGDGVAVTWRDVTAVTCVEEQRRFNEMLLDEVDAAVIATDAELHVTFWNTKAEELYGWSAEEAKGQIVAELLAPFMTREEIAERHSSILRGPVEWEMELQHKDGSVRVVSLRIAPVENANVVEAFIAVSVDITDRHEAEAERRRTAEFLGVLTAGMAEGMFACDGEGRATFVNAAAEALLGWTPGELLGEDIHARTHSRRPDGSEYRAEECPIVNAHLNLRSTRIDRDAFLRQDGTWLPVSYTASPLAEDHGGCVVVFRDISDLDDEERKAREALEKLGWVGRIQDALEDGRLVLFAQPIVDANSGLTRHYELLLRMIAPTGELVPPDRFIPVAEEFGLIGRIDRWVAEQALAIANEGCAVAFNLSARSVTSRRMLEDLRDVLQGRHADCGDLIFEITETALIEDSAAAESFVTAIVDLGCHVALDDFGAGFAGFGYIKRLPVSTLKIDRQFVYDACVDEASRHIVAAVVALARAFDLSTVAEGVENVETVALMRDLGVDCVQGYVFGRPQPAAELLRRERSNDDHEQSRARVAVAGRS